MCFVHVNSSERRKKGLKPIDINIPLQQAWLKFATVN